MLVVDSFMCESAIGVANSGQKFAKSRHGEDMIGHERTREQENLEWCLGGRCCSFLFVHTW